MTLIVNQLETYDKSNLNVIRFEFAKLQKKLEECQKEQDFFKPDIGEAARQKLVEKTFRSSGIFNFSLLFFQATATTQES